MSPENILTQNVVFNVPLTMPIELLEESLKITGTFIKRINVISGSQKIDSKETEMPRNG